MDKFSRIDKLKHKIAQYRPLSAAEVQRLREEFIIESSYNSNVRTLFKNFGEIK